MKAKNRPLPQRTCVACRQKRDKKELIRLVRTDNGVVEPDLPGKKPGRGAYLCPRKDCWVEGLKKNRLECALDTKITAENRQALLSYGSSLNGGS
jgi:hypothetical protein